MDSNERDLMSGSLRPTPPADPTPSVLPSELTLDTPCECDHALKYHAPTIPGPCLWGANVAMAVYSDGRHGERKCKCEDFRAARPTPEAPAHE